MILYCFVGVMNDDDDVDISSRRGVPGDALGVCLSSIYNLRAQDEVHLDPRQDLLKRRCRVVNMSYATSMKITTATTNQ